MPDLDQRDFDIAFTFARPAAASYRTGDGTVTTAPVDVPRFDHLANGAPRGLLIEPGQQLGQADRTTIDPLMIPEELLSAQVTVLHALDMGQGLVRRAWYSEDVVATINALLRISGHHAVMAVIPGFRERQGGRFEAGYVRYRKQSWYLTTALAATTGAALADDRGRVLIGG